MAKPKPKLMIIDGNALIHRSFHALPPTMRTKDGEPTNAVYGFVLAFLKAVRELQPEYVVLTLDEKGPTFRHERYKEYKATRVKAPDELYAQIPRVREFAQAFNVPTFSLKGFEADDLIGTISASVDGKVEKIILTGDQDTLQLVNGHTAVYTMSRGVSESVTYDEAAVKARYGITPEQLVDYKALRGDPSDNIPGVKGIGEKTASELLQEFGTLDGLYSYVDELPIENEITKNKKLKDESKNSKIENRKSKIDNAKIKPRIVDLLRQYKKEAFLSKELATIKRDVPIEFDLEATRFRDFDQDSVVDFLSRLEFNSLLPRAQALFNSNVVITKEEQTEKTADKFERNRREFKYELIDSEAAFARFLKLLKAQTAFTFDTETTSFDPLTAKLLGISFSWKKGEAFYLNMRPADGKTGKVEAPDLFNYSSQLATRNSQLIRSHWLDKLKPVFEDATVEKHGHNAKYDIRVMAAAGITVRNANFDTMIASYLLHPGTRQHNLDAVTFTELKFEKISKDDLLGRGKEKQAWADLSAERLMLYSAEDADWTERLVAWFRPQLKAAKLDQLFNEIEMPLVPILGRMEDAGITLDPGVLARLSKELTKKLVKLEREIHKLAGTDFNINSTQQLADILFGKLGISTEAIARTKTGRSTAASELDKLKDAHPIVPLLMEYRELIKLRSTYVDALPEQVNTATGRLHTSFNQTVAATGRLSSTDPNLQNIPVRTDYGKEIRTAFIAAPGKVLLAFDYSQIELRLAAHFSGDPKMVKAFQAQADIHTATAAEINEVELSAVTPAMRREAKAVNFGILYGQGPHGLAQSADIPYARARDFIDHYFVVFEGLKRWIDETIEGARQSGEVRTLFGRARQFPEINSTVMPMRKAAERMAVNTPLQGTAADMIKAAMVAVDRALAERDDIRMLLQVHDELIFEVDEGSVAEAAALIKPLMENVAALKVPVVVDVKVGKNWGGMEKMTNDE